MRKTIQCPLLYLIAIHLVAVVAIVVIVAPWFGFWMSKARVDEASAVLVERGWWGDDWKEYAHSTGGWGSSGFAVDRLTERYVRMSDANGNIVAHLKFDRDGELEYIRIIPPGLMTSWWFGRSPLSTSGWLISARVTDNPEIHRSPNATFERFTQYRDVNATGMLNEQIIRTAPYPAPLQRFRLKADAWEEVFAESPDTASASDPGTDKDEASDPEPTKPDNADPNIP